MEILSVGHSTMEIGRFLELLTSHGITAVADVRSSPFSRNVPQFNRDELRASLAICGVTYVFLGKELGGRPRDPGLYTSGVADYEKMASTEEFRSGIVRLEQGAQKYRVVMLCSERNPLHCHRCLLVGRALHDKGICIHHIIPGSAALTQEQIEGQLLSVVGMAENDMFMTPQERLNQAYREQSRHVAYSEDTRVSQKKVASG